MADCSQGKCFELCPAFFPPATVQSISSQLAFENGFQSSLSEPEAEKDRAWERLDPISLQRRRPALEQLEQRARRKILRKRNLPQPHGSSLDFLRRVYRLDEITHAMPVAAGRPRRVSTLPQPLTSAFGTRLTN